MRKSIWLTCLLILSACLFLLTWHSRNKTGTSTSSDVALPHQSSQISNLSIKAGQLNPPAVKNSSLTTSVPVRSSLAQANGSNAFFDAVAPDWEVPITFYGKVIDENSNPVAGANAQFSWVATPQEALGGPGESSSSISDSQGLFSLHGAQGPSLQVNVAKDGYYSSRSNSSNFGYAAFKGGFSPDPINPIIFHLRKKKIGEPLIEYDFPSSIGQIWQLHHDGTPIDLDLLHGNKGLDTQGEVKLELWRDISNMKAQTFDWKLQLSVPGGGIQPTDEEFDFQAPMNGYQSSVAIDMPATNANWVSELRTKYYIILPNGNCGRIDLYFLAYNGVFKIHSAINPTGSRNLEPAQ